MNWITAKNAAAGRWVTIAAMGGGLLAAPVRAQDAVQPTAVATALPAGIQTGSPLAQVVKLAQAGVDEGIIQAYVTNSASTFNLDSDKIIYLKDAGVPNELVTGMMQRDRVLEAQIAATAPPPPPATDVPAPAVTAAAQPPPVDAAPDPAVPPAEITSASDFYAMLAPYGSWVIVEGHGLCWLPGVTIYHHEWQPYGDHGHWVYTDYGWYWTSDYSWGWAPFHYGRWFRNPRLGWCWQPDTAWGPSWVTWRYADDYCGWAPLPPGAYYGDTGWVYAGADVGDDCDFGLNADDFIFVATASFCDPQPFRHRLDHDVTGQVFRRSTVVNSYHHDTSGYVNQGLSPASITLATHTPIHTFPLRSEAGVAGRFPVNEPPHHAAGTVSPEYAPSAPVQNYHPAVTPNPAPNRAYQNYNWQTQPRYNEPAAAQGVYDAPVSRPNGYEAPTAPENRYYPAAPAANHDYAPVPPPRPVAPEGNYRPYSAPVEVHQEPVREFAPPSEPRPEPRPAPVERPEHSEPAHTEPAHVEPAHTEPSEPAKSGESSDKKSGSH